MPAIMADHDIEGQVRGLLRLLAPLCGRRA